MSYNWKIGYFVDLSMQISSFCCLNMALDTFSFDLRYYGENFSIVIPAYSFHGC